jgi:hypothetical protein
MSYRLVSLALFSVMTLICTGCGGGQSSSNTSPQSVSVSVTSSSSSVLLGNTQQLSATVTGSSNTAVNWRVNGVAGGNSTVGTITNAGLYTSPVDLPNPGTVTVQATSQADTSASGKVSLMITSDIAVTVSTVPSNVQSVAANAVLQVSAAITSGGHPDGTVTWSVNGVAGGNSTVGTIASSGPDTATYMAPAPVANPLSVNISAVSVADSAKTSSVLFKVLFVPLATGSISNASPTPMTPVQITTVGLDPSSPVSVQFSNNSGFAVTESAIRVASDGTVTVAVPLYLDPSSGQISPGSVSLVLAQGNQSSAPITVNIQDLPQVSAYGTALGDISHAVLMMEAMVIGQEINQLQAFQFAPRNTVDTTQAQITLNNLLNAVIQARSDVDRVSMDNTVVISNGTLPDGTTVQFDRVSLDLMDRISGVFLTQTFGNLILSAQSTSSPAARAALAATGRFARIVSEPGPNRDRRTLRRLLNPPQAFRVTQRGSSSSQEVHSQPVAAPELTFAQAKQLLIAMQTIQATTGFMAEGTASATAKNLSDEIRALAGGFSTALSLFPKSATNEVLGGLGTIVSDSDIILRCFAADGEFIAGLATGDQNKINQAVSDSNAIDRTKIWNTVLDLASIPVAAEYKVLGFLGSTEANLINVGLDTAEIQNLEAVDATGLAVVNSFPTPSSNIQGIAQVMGNVNVPTNQGIFAPQSGITLSSNGDSLSTIADPSGNYQLFLPLQASPFNYASADVTIVDPISQSLLGSALVDLSNLTTSSPLQIPTIQGSACSNADFDGDDPDCD